MVTMQNGISVDTRIIFMGNQFHSKYLFRPTLPLFVKYVDMINIDNLARYFNNNYVHIYLIERVYNQYWHIL